MRLGGDAARAVIAPVLEDRGFTGVSAREVVQAVRHAGGLESVERGAEAASARAREALRGLPSGPSLEALLFATEYAVTRKF